MAIVCLEFQESGSDLESIWGALSLWDGFRKPGPTDGGMKYTVNWSSLFVDGNGTQNKERNSLKTNNSFQKTSGQQKGKKKNSHEDLNGLVSSLKQQALTKKYWKNKGTKSTRLPKSKYR